VLPESLYTKTFEILFLTFFQGYPLSGWKKGKKQALKNKYQISQELNFIQSNKKPFFAGFSAE
jgi:hypothetical protein